jgi:hypothetical protein
VVTVATVTEKGMRFYNRTSELAEVKRQKKNFKPVLFASKVEHLKNKLLPNYQIDMVCLSLEDM